MPWQETDSVLERHHFAQDLDSGQWTMTELCLRYGVRRNTGYKWLDRYRQRGPRGLYDHSRAPRSCPHETPADVIECILEEHTRFGWGARKILKRLRTRDPKRTWPARSTIFDILARHDRVQHRRRRRHWKHPGAAPFNTTAPNQIWTIDFKGQFRMRNGVYCYPLTILDHFSRYLLGCHGLLDVAGAGVKAHLRPLFRTGGLPDAIRSDNGAPFASTGIQCPRTLCQLCPRLLTASGVEDVACQTDMRQSLKLAGTLPLSSYCRDEHPPGIVYADTRITRPACGGA